MCGIITTSIIVTLGMVFKRVAVTSKNKIVTVTKISQTKTKSQLLSIPKKPLLMIFSYEMCHNSMYSNLLFYLLFKTTILELHITTTSRLKNLKEWNIFTGGVSSLTKTLKLIKFRWCKDCVRRNLLELQHLILARVEFCKHTREIYVKNLGSRIFTRNMDFKKWSCYLLLAIY